MTITTAKLTGIAGLAAIAAGLIFIVIQFIHPPENAATVTTVEWATVSLLTATMATLAIVGISGLYLRNVQRMGVLGLIGYVLFATCFMVITAWSFVEIVVLPPLAEQAPQFVDDFLAVPGGGHVVGDVGAAKVATGITAVGYLLGGLIFGIALFRARVVVALGRRAPRSRQRHHHSRPGATPRLRTTARAPHGRRPRRSRLLAVESATRRQHSVGHRSTQCPARIGRRPDECAGRAPGRDEREAGFRSD